MNVLRYNKFNFLKEIKIDESINESTDFGGMGQSPLGPGYGFAQDPSMTIYSDGSSPYIDSYHRMSSMVQDLNRIMRDLYSQQATSITNHKFDYFLEDIDEYTDIKILRIFINNKTNIDIFISFIFMEEEFFGVYRNYNDINKEMLSTDLFTDPRFTYIDREYKLKLDNYFSKVLLNWFIPNIGDYQILSDELKCKNVLGDIIMLPKGKTITVKGYNNDVDNKPFLMIRIDTEILKITGNDFYYFKYRCKGI